MQKNLFLLILCLFVTITGLYFGDGIQMGNESDFSISNVKSETDLEITPKDLAAEIEITDLSEKKNAGRVTASVDKVTSQEKVLPSQYLLEEFPIILQMPELPTGCEITAMTMVLHFYHYKADKVTMATQYLPTAPANLHYGDDGTLYGNDLNEYFIGDPTTDTGYICGVAAILTAANRYLNDCGSSLRALDRTGASPEELYQLISQNIPVVVWVTIEMQDRLTPQGWYTENGDYVDWSSNDHGAVLIGYTENTVTIADPISGLVEYSRQQFEKVFSSRSYQCAILQ